MKNEEELIKIFGNMMLNELVKNIHKGSILDFRDFNQIITEFEYHKAKLFIAIRTNNKDAIKEYLADCGNYLLCLGSLLEVFDNDLLEDCTELNKEVDIFIKVKVNQQSKNQKIK